MKIAVAVEDCDPLAEVAYGGGRAPFFLIFDEEGDLLDCLATPFSGIERHVRATWTGDEAEISEEWLVEAETAQDAVSHACTHTRFPPHHVEVRRTKAGEGAADVTPTPRRVVRTG